MGRKDLKRLAAEAVAEDHAASGEIAAERPSKKARVENRSLFVRGLAPTTTSEALTDFFSQHFPVKHATVVIDPQTKTSRGFGFVTFTDAEDTQAAKEQLQSHKLDGRPIALDIAETRQRQPGAGADDAAAKKEDRRAALAEARKAPKLIIRNLPWSIKHSDQLAALFRSYGLVKYADIPQNKGKMSGFGFVTMRGKKNAQAAMDAVNGKVVDGRTLSVDWAVSKDEWQKHNQQPEKKEKKSEKKEKAEDDDDATSEEDEEEDDEKDKKDDEDEEEDEDLKNFMKNHMENLEDEDDDEKEDDDEEENSDEDDAASGGAPVPPQKTQGTDNRTTLFIRNLPFSTTDAELKAHFQQFGLIRYARVVYDRATDRPAGTGFVCFAKEDEFKACLKGAPRQQQSTVANKKSILQNEMADEAGKYTIDGRVLQVSQAVSKDEANRLAETGAAAREGKNQDKRRIYLLSEGAIPKDSPVFDMLPAAEVKLREQSMAQRKKLIQSNPSLHISLTRLAVRNIPRDLDSKGLKALARQAVVGFASDVKQGLRQPLSKEENARGGEEDKEAERRRKEKGKGVVKQTKIMFENKEGSKVAEADGAGKSRGYGFIEYSSHRWALMGLRWLNGHAVQSDNGKTQRLIVEFAIENAQVVARRKELQLKSREYQQNGGHENGPRGDPRDGPRDGQRGGFRDGQRGGPRDGQRGGFRDGQRGGPRDGQRGFPRGKDFSVSKGNWGKGKDQGRGNNFRGDDSSKGEKQGASKEDLQQKIIARKRMTRKKKAQGRS